MNFSPLPATLSVLIFAALLNPGVASEDEVLKPHSIYMRRLREHLSDYNISVPNSWDQSDSVQGKLVATSIETTNSTGRGEPKECLGQVFTYIHVQLLVIILNQITALLCIP